jgi:hypothetical protein
LSTDYTVITSDGKSKRNVVKRKVTKRTKQFLKRIKSRVIKLVLNFMLKLANWVVDKEKIGLAYCCGSHWKSAEGRGRKFAASGRTFCCKCSSLGHRIRSDNG